MTERGLWLCLGLAMLLLSCGRTALNGPCPPGYEQNEARECRCAVDEACPAGHVCVDGSCICASEQCCPAGFTFIGLGQCECRSAECCPTGYLLVEVPIEALDGGVADGGAEPSDGGGDVPEPANLQTELLCQCQGDACCPEGMAWDEENEGCICNSDLCCPVGYAWEPEAARCECRDSSCCPQGYRYVDGSGECVCASNLCCPDGFVYSDAAGGCVCVGEGCCPDGFVRDDGEERCVCADDSACPPGMVCDQEAQRCVCEDDAACGADRFCNELGFCQSLLGCFSNRDCPANHICDHESTRCIPAPMCLQQSHCVGDDRVCALDFEPPQCIAGCLGDGDCELFQLCINGRCVGEFPGDVCATHEFCPTYEFCENGRCVPSVGDYCAQCQRGNECDSGACLYTVAEGTRDFGFCGVFCDVDADCPSGMECDDVFYRCNPRAPSCPRGLPCELVPVVNEEPAHYCVGSDGLPAVIEKYCGPRGAVCPE